MERSLRRAQQQIQEGDLSATARVEHFRRRLQELTSKRIGGQQVRCRAKWLDSGETSQKLFAAYERIKGEKGHITEMQDGSSTV